MSTTAMKWTTRARFFATKTGVPHSLSAATMDEDGCKTAQAKLKSLGTVADVAAYAGLSPEAVIALEKDCQKCGTVALAKSFATTPASKRAAAKATADETRAKASGKPTKATKVDKPVIATATAKEAKATAPKPEKLDAAGKNRAKAQSMADAINAVKGWTAEVTNGGPRVMVTAVNADETQTLVTTFVDGKLDLENMPELRVGEWRGILRNVSAVLMQVGAKDGNVPFPKPGSGRAKRVRADDDEREPSNDGPELADLSDAEIIARVAGKTISWRNTQAKVTETAKVPTKSKMTKIDAHPKTGAKVLHFASIEDVVDGAEVLGGQRSVAVAKISDVR